MSRRIIKRSQASILLALTLMAGTAVQASMPASARADTAWNFEQLVPAQAEPGSQFDWTSITTNVGTTAGGGGATLKVTSPPGTHFMSNSGKSSNAWSCAQNHPSTTLSCFRAASTASGQAIPLIATVMVEADTEGQVGRFHVQVESSDAPTLSESSLPLRVVPESAGYGIAELDSVSLNRDGSDATQAGGHPYEVATTVRFNTEVREGKVFPAGNSKNIVVDLPVGYVGNPKAVPTCSHDLFNVVNETDPSASISTASCPTDTQVGTVVLWLKSGVARVPVFNLVTNGNRPAEFGFNISGKPVRLFPEVRPDDSGLRARFVNIDNTLNLFGSKLILWGNPVDHGHDSLRRFCGGKDITNEADGVNCPVAATVPPVAFYTNPTSCTPGRGIVTTMKSESWEGAQGSGSFESHDNNGNPLGMTGCDRVPFDPVISVQPTTDSAERPSGLDFGLSVPDGGILNPDGISQAHLRKAVVKLPAGVTLNPSAAEGLGVCSPSQYAAETLLSTLGEGCPATAKIGTLDITTPVLSENLTGTLFLASPYENPFNSLISVYMVARNVNRGIVIKAAGRVEPDATTGQIVTTFDNLPQLPFRDFNLHFREGARAPLVTPPTCGTYTTEAVLTPWSAADNPAAYEVARLTSSFTVDHGVDGGACPSGGLAPFGPTFEAGTLNNNAGTFSPVQMRLLRRDGEQEMTKFSAELPPGVTGRLAGVSTCSDLALSFAKTKTGREELVSPSCPDSSQIGRVTVGAGVGSVLAYVPGKIYLAGPFAGAPLSAAVITPAVAGPFDVGTVVTRVALAVDPRTAEVRVDGERSDPIPHILQGIPLKIRDLRIYVDRDNFILNPTSCDPSQTRAQLWGSQYDVLDPADDRPVSLSARFQAANCANLGFKPRLNLRLKGGTRRGAHPALRAVLRPRRGDANISSAVVKLPRSAFLDQAHIRTICTRVQFAADACPRAAIYGRVSAITPLLDEPLRGPVYLRSSNHDLPDLVFDLHGLIDVEAVGRIDSVRGGIRASFEGLPDAPITRVVVEMQGGRKGLIVNSRDLCASTSRAAVSFEGQNGRLHRIRPVMKPACGKARAKNG